MENQACIPCKATYALSLINPCIFPKWNGDIQVLSIMQRVNMSNHINAIAREDGVSPGHRNSEFGKDYATDHRVNNIPKIASL